MALPDYKLWVNTTQQIETIEHIGLVFSNQYISGGQPHGTVIPYSYVTSK